MLSVAQVGNVSTTVSARDGNAVARTSMIRPQALLIMNAAFETPKQLIDLNDHADH